MTSRAISRSSGSCSASRSTRAAASWARVARSWRIVVDDGREVGLLPAQRRGSGPGRPRPRGPPTPPRCWVRRRSMSSSRSSRLTTRSRSDPRRLHRSACRRPPPAASTLLGQLRLGIRPVGHPAWLAVGQAALGRRLAVGGERLLHRRDGDLDHRVVGLLGGDAPGARCPAGTASGRPSSRAAWRPSGAARRRPPR